MKWGALIFFAALPALAQFGDDSRRIGQWLVPGTFSGTLAMDASGRSEPATATGITFQANGIATSTGAATNILQTKFTGTFRTNDSCSFSAWFSTTSTADLALFGFNAGSPGTYLEFGQQSSPRLWFFSCRDSDSSGTDVTTLTNNFADGGWHFVTATYDGEARQIRIYIDNVSSTSATVTANSGSANKLITNGVGLMAVSRPSAGPLRPWNGRIAFPRMDQTPATMGDHLARASEMVP